MEIKSFAPCGNLATMFHELIIVASTLTGVFGAVATYIGVRAFKRSGENSLLFASAGFSLITVGTVLGVLCAFPDYHLYELELHLGQSALVAVGLFSIVYSISRAGRLA